MQPSNLELVMQTEGSAAYPKEACGLVIKKGRKTLALRCDNSAEDPCRDFRISEFEYARCADEGEVVGVWHTHPTGSSQPSSVDRIQCDASELPWYILGVARDSRGVIEFGKVTVLQPSDEVLPYAGRVYLYGVHDCYTLVQDYYQREYGIVLKDYKNPHGWWLRGENCFSDNFSAEGFEVVSGPPRVGDIFLIQSESPVPNHVAIYTGDDRILHHCTGRLSKHDIYGGHWLKHTVGHIRHRSFTC